MSSAFTVHFTFQQDQRLARCIWWRFWTLQGKYLRVKQYQMLSTVLFLYPESLAGGRVIRYQQHMVKMPLIFDTASVARAVTQSQFGTDSGSEDGETQSDLDLHLIGLKVHVCETSACDHVHSLSIACTNTHSSCIGNVVTHRGRSWHEKTLRESLEFSCFFFFVEFTVWNRHL